MNILGTALCIGLFSHLLQIDDGLIGVMACAGKVVAGIFYAFATVEWVYYLGNYTLIIFPCRKRSNCNYGLHL